MYFWSITSIHSFMGGRCVFLVPFSSQSLFACHWKHLSQICVSSCTAKLWQINKVCMILKWKEIFSGKTATLVQNGATEGQLQKIWKWFTTTRDLQQAGWLEYLVTLFLLSSLTNAVPVFRCYCKITPCFPSCFNIQSVASF